MYDETTFTAHGEPGWHAWNQYSPEVEFCEFVGRLQRLVRPKVVLETGVGGQRITEHLMLDGNTTYLGFESDPQWRKPPCVLDRDTPTADDMFSADFVILDSDPPWRQQELNRWKMWGQPGSLCVIHDCGNGHSPATFHMEMRRRVTDLGYPGTFLSNPRGGWIGWHP